MSRYTFLAFVLSKAVNYDFLLFRIFLGMRYVFLATVMTLYACTSEPDGKRSAHVLSQVADESGEIVLDQEEANRLAQLPMSCIHNQWPYKSGLVIAQPSDNALPIDHHPAFYGCFDWHSAVHGHWSLIYLLKKFPELKGAQQIRSMIDATLTADNIRQEVEYFALNSDTKSFERTYGWAWVLKLAEELHQWEDDQAQRWSTNLQPLVDYITVAYIEYLPKLLYPIRVGEHSNTAFGLSFAYDYASAVGDVDLQQAVSAAALRFYSSDVNCPISWEPSGYDFLSPCLQEMDIMRKVLSSSEYDRWSRAFLPALFDGNLSLDPAEVADRSDGKLVHLDGLNFSRAWCLYSMSNCDQCRAIADRHLQYSLDKIVDGDYAGQHWLASFALYAYQQREGS